MDISFYDNVVTERATRSAFGGIIVGVLLSTVLWALIALVVRFLLRL